jgi:hypothetical protein
MDAVRSGRRLRSILGVFALGSVCLSLLSCNWARGFTLPDPAEIVWRSATLTLAWDPPLADLPHSPERVEYYQIYYCERTAGAWAILGEVPATDYPQYTVLHDTVGNGSFIFAVRAVWTQGLRSPLHSSLDNTADPLGGWYVTWFY